MTHDEISRIEHLVDKYHYRNGKALFIGLALKSSIDQLEKNLGFIAEGRVKNRVAYLMGMFKKQGYELPHFKRGSRKSPKPSPKIIKYEIFKKM